MTRNRALARAGAVFLIALAIAAAFVQLAVRRQTERQRAAAVEAAAGRAFALEKQIDQLQAAAAALAVFLRRGGGLEGFASLGAEVLASYPSVRAVFLARDGRAVAAHPADAPEAAIALDAAAAGGAPRLVGPLRLDGGELAVLARAPVGAGEAVFASLRIATLLRAAGLDDLEARGYGYRLVGVDPETGRQRTVARSTELDLASPVEHAVAVAGGGWTLRIAPRDGWAAWSERRLEITIALVLALLAALYTYDLARKPERLRHQIDRRSRNLELARDQLSQEMHLREQAEARERWREFDRISRLVLVATAHTPAGATAGEVEERVRTALEEAEIQFRSGEIVAALDRLEQQGTLRRSAEDLILIDRSLRLSLPEIRKPLRDVARETLKRIGAYRIGRRLGGGGMGEVFRATNVHDDRVAALKLLYPHALSDRVQRQRFEREGAIVANIRDSTIIKVLERGEHEGRLYLAMELIEGDTLEDLTTRGPLPPAEAYAIMTDVAHALAILHGAGVVHRDLKPSNVIRPLEGRCVLLDFGLARDVTSETLTRTDTVLGTLPYLPPERVRGQRGGASVDVWAAGLIYYQLLIGRLPWRNPGDLTVVHEILGHEPVAFHTLRRFVDPEVTELIMDCLEPDPDVRIPDGRELAARLRRIRPPETPPPPLPPSDPPDQGALPPTIAIDRPKEEE